MIQAPALSWPVMKTQTCLLPLALVLLAPSLSGEQLTYYVGVDSEKILVQFPHEESTYIGLPNPNFGRTPMSFEF